MTQCRRIGEIGRDVGKARVARPQYCTDREWAERRECQQRRRKGTADACLVDLPQPRQRCPGTAQREQRERGHQTEKSQEGRRVDQVETMAKARNDQKSQRETRQPPSPARAPRFPLEWV
jgi:hypothetical protein